MGHFLLRRLVQALLVLFLIACTNFTIINAAPGDMVDVMAGESGAADAAYLAGLRQKFSLDQSVPVRLGRYLASLATLDLGYSFRNNESVVHLILSRFPATLLLMFSALGIALVGGVVLGVAQAIGAQINPSWEQLAGYAVFLAVLVIRPQGLTSRGAQA